MTVKQTPRRYAYPVCRTFGHTWKWELEHKKERVFGDRIVLSCSSCGMLRLDGVGLTGEILTRSYVQPDGYRLDAEAQPTRAQWRKRWIKSQKRQ